jgi:adenylate kinase
MIGAILLLGPTGSGKTPLGEEIERRGIGGRPCAHFDFGEHLRRIAAGTWLPPTLTTDDIRIVTRAIEERALLTDAQFHIAEGVLDAFINENARAPGAVVILNGMPRHAGQARGVERLAHVSAVVELRCGPETVLTRIARNTGGDRTGREDDALEAVRRKLEIYAGQTLPLLDYYRAAGIPVHAVNVSADASAVDMLAQLEQNIRF